MDCPKRRRDTEAASSGLPDDPLVEILSRVPAKSLCRFSDCDDEPCSCYGGDGEARGAEDSDEEELPRYGFVDVLQRSERYYQLTVLDVEGNIQKIIPLPCQAGRESWTLFDYIGRSQGCLHYINHEMDDEGFDGDGLLIWVLEDYERQQWVLKDTVSYSKLFGERNCHKDIDSDYNAVGIHPDQSLVFLVQGQKLISYHMVSKEVRDLCTLEHG
ncbi:unnamed protein product [Miscanthus lutarioriparius]|uniref:F-box domain-containing protein n=1 Tax=Miscanthus lutarioriparius TaxID=422564 RepID=A0A811NH08_9POAL|nr:unnamed protein product [Miscanthus lutarioriparius]